MLKSDKAALTLSIETTEGEKKALEGKVLEFEKKKVTASKRKKELKAQNNLLEEQLEVSKEKNLDPIPFHSKACMRFELVVWIGE